MSSRHTILRAFPRIIAALVLPLLVCRTATATFPFDDTQMVMVSPALPSSLDQTVLEITTFCGVQVTPPVLEGNTIVVAVDASNPQPPCPPPLDVTWLRFPLGILGAGSYTVQQIVNGKLSLETTVFQVAPPTTSLLLLGGHFTVTASFPHPGQGTPALVTAHAAQLSDASGTFWFFAGGNVELAVKILDGRAINNHYWVFIAGATDLAFNVTVTDLLFPAGCSVPGSPPCLAKTYSVPAGNNHNVIDLGYWADFP